MHENPRTSCRRVGLWVMMGVMMAGAVSWLHQLGRVVGLPDPFGNLAPSISGAGRLPVAIIGLLTVLISRSLDVSIT